MIEEDFDTIEWGRAYVELGWRVFPVGADRVPHIKWKMNAGRSANFVRHYWHRYPRADIGVACGQSGLVVIDVDVKSGIDGFASLRRLTGGKISFVTPTSESPSGGRHLYFKHPGQGKKVITNAGKLAPGLDVRADGGMAILPPGRGRRWFGSLDPWGVSLAPLPAWVPVIDNDPTPTPGCALPAPIVHSDGQCTSFYGEAALTRAYVAIEQARCGSQEQVLNREYFSIGGLVAGGEINRAIALQLLTEAAGRMPSFDSRRPWRPAELQTKINRAFEQGLRSPRRAAA
jgi:hypothetical protein